MNNKSKTIIKFLKEGFNKNDSNSIKNYLYNISEISKERENYCEIKCPKEMPYELIENQKCVNNCTITQINKKLCKINFISENKSEKNEEK